MLRAVFTATASGGPSTTLTVGASTTYLSYITLTSNGTTDTVTATASGGTGPYTYFWEEVTDENGSFNTIDDPTNAVTGFHFVGLRFSGYDVATFKCTATDSVGNTGYIIVTVYVQYEEI